MKKFAVYEWWTDDEGGFGVCLSSKISKIMNQNLLNPQITKEVFGTFDTLGELVNLLYKRNPTYYGSIEAVLKEDGVTLFERCLSLED